MSCSDKNRTMELIPPTQNALLVLQQELPSPEGYGWLQCKWSPSSMDYSSSDLSKACTELVKHGCKSSRGCGGRCVLCKMLQQKCTELYSCANVRNSNYYDVFIHAYLYLLIANAGLIKIII